MLLKTELFWLLRMHCMSILQIELNTLMTKLSAETSCISRENLRGILDAFEGLLIQ